MWDLGSGEIGWDDVVLRLKGIDGLRVPVRDRVIIGCFGGGAGLSEGVGMVWLAETVGGVCGVCGVVSGGWLFLFGWGVRRW